jgi:hypothetical protein
MNASPRVFWSGLAIVLVVALAIWWLTDTGWGAALLMGYVRVMLVPSRSGADGPRDGSPVVSGRDVGSHACAKESA